MILISEIPLLICILAKNCIYTSKNPALLDLNRKESYKISVISFSSNLIPSRYCPLGNRKEMFLFLRKNILFRRIICIRSVIFTRTHFYSKIAKFSSLSFSASRFAGGN